MENKAEIWKSHPEIAGIEVSNLGRVRTLDRVVSGENGTRSLKGRVLKQQLNHNGYLQVGFRVNGKRVNKSIHRLVAQTFIKNPDNLPEINHKDSDPTNNNVSNLERCSRSYNQKYREKYGISATESLGHPVFAINLTTLKVYRFRSQHEASRALGVYQASINKVIKGKYKQAGGFWFTNDDGHKDAQSIKDYFDQAVKSFSAK